MPLKILVVEREASIEAVFAGFSPPRTLLHFWRDS